MSREPSDPNDRPPGSGDSRPQHAGEAAPSDAIRDDELFGFALGDESLGVERLAAIRAAVAADERLAERLAAVAAALGGVFDVPEPDAAFERRTYERIAWQLPRAAMPWARPRPVLAIAASLLVAVGVGYALGRLDPEPPRTNPPVIAEHDAALPQLLGADAANRVLASYLVGHFEATERALLVAANSPDQSDTARELAQQLVESNRLYAAAAARAGKPELADFLRQLEPVLVELANRDDLAKSGVPAAIRDQDLTFKTRAAAALAKRELADGEIEL